jgi:hypothetical protein
MEAVGIENPQRILTQLKMLPAIVELPQCRTAITLAFECIRTQLANSLDASMAPRSQHPRRDFSDDDVGRAQKMDVIR